MNSDGTDNTTDKTSETSAVPSIISEDAVISADPSDTDLNDHLSQDDINTSDSDGISPELSADADSKVSQPSQNADVKASGPSVRTKQKNDKLHNAVQISLGLLAGTGTGYLLLYLLTPVLSVPSDFLLILIFIIVSVFINLNLYNLGQLIAGRINDGRFIAYQFTCLRFYKAEGMLRRRLTVSHSFEGHCSLMPPSDRPYHVNKYIAFYTGGAAACIVFGCACAVTALLSANASGSLTAPGTLPAIGKTAYFILFLWINAIISLVFAVLNMIPVFWGDSPSDGIILFALLKKNPYTAQLITLRALTVQLAAGIRPSDLQIPDIIPVRTIKEKNMQINGLLTAVKKIPGYLFILTGRLKSFLIGKILNSGIMKPKPAGDGSVIIQAINNTADAVKAAEISDMPQPAEQEDLSDKVSEISESPDITKKKPLPEKFKFNMGVLVYKIKLRFCPRKINKSELEIELFPKPLESENNLSACTLLLKLYDYYIALDNAEHTDMRTHLLVIEENMTRIPRQMLQRVCRELCFYYSIDKNAVSAAHYMEMMENSSEQKKELDNLRARAYYEMYINRRYKAAFSICRNAMEISSADDTGGLAVMNRELIKALVSLIHQKSTVSKTE